MTDAGSVVIIGGWLVAAIIGYLPFAITHRLIARKFGREPFTTAMLVQHWAFFLLAVLLLQAATFFIFNV